MKFYSLVKIPILLNIVKTLVPVFKLIIIKWLDMKKMAF
uniref:PRP39-2 n=1 Tax=Arundo donax TaxID=35708 RepID=A0A0A9ENB3_ARUDO